MAPLTPSPVNPDQIDVSTTTSVPQDDENEVQESFPVLDDPAETRSRRPSSTGNTDASRSRGQSNTSSFQGRLRSASKVFQESNPPTGFLMATGQLASSMPSYNDIRTGGFNSDGWSGEGQIQEQQRRASVSQGGGVTTGPESVPQRNPANPISRLQSGGGDLHHALVVERGSEDASRSMDVGRGAMTNGSAVDDTKATKPESDANTSQNVSTAEPAGQPQITAYDNGYQFPPKHGWAESTRIGLAAFWKFFITPFGFIVVIYGLNVIAWGGMLFLLLCNASPAMCHPSCNDINSGRRVWIEYDSQIVNSLFCVTGFGLIPWRFRDLYYLLQYRLMKNEVGLRRLAGINRSWFRLAGSQELPLTLSPVNIETETTTANIPESSIPYPVSRIPNAPLTGIRAPPTPVWKLDLAIWTMVWNTFLQVVLSAFMWKFNRVNRPPWATGLFVALACIVAGIGGTVGFIEGKKVKGIEGVPVNEKDLEILRKDQEAGIVHYNNIKDAPLKEKKEKTNGHHHKGEANDGNKGEGKAIDEL